ncbi:MAG: SET domain-containing protein-lysine N-methyltransferase [Cyclobacteriaceae bacterium]|nr:SET domain-containing protein-lysine N-methyltransferase [Cyclobacteriaceae bacterium]
MKVCVLQPDYSTTDVDYKNYDPARDLTSLLPEDDVVDHVFLNKLTTYRQLKEASKKGYDIYVNLCEGYLEWEVPSIDVIHTLELLNLPYTGPNPVLYDPPKPLMKYVAYGAGVKTPASVDVMSLEDIDDVLDKLTFPMFIKPAKAGDSLGVDELSLVNTESELRAKITAILDEYPEILVEEYIAGREFTVLVAANKDAKSCTVYKPVEYIFPKGRHFKTYALKTSELHPESNVPCHDFKLERALKTATQQIFTAFGGVGYARLDFRMDANGQIYFLEINFTCSAFYVDSYQGSADHILNYDPAGKSGFLKHIIGEGIARHKAKQKKYVLKGNSVAGYGIAASRRIRKNEVIFMGEEMSQRIVSKSFVEANWNQKQKNDFRHYAYPISKEVYILWDENPINWAPQNHSCSPNTAYQGLNVVATRDISIGEELTLDYALFLDETLDPFVCQCGSPNCREIISGTKENVITGASHLKARAPKRQDILVPVPVPERLVKRAVRPK